MKNLIKIFVLCLLISSCSSDSSSDETQNMLVGKWTYEIEIDYSASGDVVSVNDFSGEPCYQMTTFEYTSSGQMIKVSYDFDVTCIQNPTRTYSYSVDGNNLTISSNGTSEYLTIEENTSTYLKLKKTYSDNTYTVTEYSKLE